MPIDPLVRRRQLPPDPGWERLELDGWPIRAVRWEAPVGSPGSLLFVGGRADFIEKYSEAYWTWRSDWGLGVATFDWRGQGLSGRPGGDPHKGQGDFDCWTDDLDRIVAWFAATMPPPHYLVAHSMGGHLALRHLARGNSPIARAVLLAPMLGIRTAPLPPKLARRLADAAVRAGFGNRYALLQRGYGPWQQRPERQALLTGCPDRFTDEHWWIAGTPELALGGVTWGWLASASRSIDHLFAAQALERITTPLLLLAGEQERLVEVAAIKRAAERLPAGEFRLIAGGRHELLRDVGPVRDATHAAIRNFLLGPAS